MTTATPVQAPDINDLMSSGGGAAAKFPEIGTVVRGTITSTPTTRQATEMGTGEPVFSKAGNPIWEVIINLDTDQADPNDADDDGKRTVYAKNRMWFAIKDAVLASGGKLEQGGTLAIEYYADGEPPKAGFNAPKLYRAEYKAPALDVNTVGQQAPQQAAPAPAPSGPLL